MRAIKDQDPDRTVFLEMALISILQANTTQFALGNRSISAMAKLYHMETNPVEVARVLLRLAGQPSPPVCRVKGGWKAVPQVSKSMPILAYSIPDVQDRVPKPKRRGKGNGWAKVSIPKERLDDLQALAECVGLTLHYVLQSAVFQKICALSDLIGVESWDAQKLTHDERRQIARQTRGVWGCSQIYMGRFGKS